MPASLPAVEATPEPWAGLLASAHVVLVHCDERLRLRHCTAAARELFELRPADLGRTLRELAGRFRDPELLADARAVLRHRLAREAEVLNVHGRAYLRRALPHRDASGGPAGLVLVFTDITRGKRAETALRSSEIRHRLMLEGIREYGIFLLDREGCFAGWTSGAERIFGYSKAEALGHRLDLIHPPEDRASGQAMQDLRLARDQGRAPVERWHARKDGSRFWGTGMIYSLNDEHGELYGYVKVLRDNTDRKRGEEALKQAKRDAEDANAGKDHFLANVSHELRTPLATTLLWAKLLNGGNRVKPALLREGLAAIEKSTSEQQALIEELMDISRMAAGRLQLNLTTLRLPSLVREVLVTIRSLAISQGVRLEERCEEDVGPVRADPLRLRQILTNLLTNALKFTPPRGRIEVRLARRSHGVELRVSDSGRGIAAEFLPHVFDRFAQESPGNGGGLGLGLAITRQLVELHDGKITATSAGLGRGATFTVWLPLADPRAADAIEAPPATEQPPSLAGLRVLLVEDIPGTRRALAAVLEGAGAAVSAVGSVRTALASHALRRPDLILSDLGLGTESGHDLLREIRRRDLRRHRRPLPAVALTAYADERNRQQALAAGFERLLTKPVEPRVLLRALAEVKAAAPLRRRS